MTSKRECGLLIVGNTKAGSLLRRLRHSLCGQYYQGECPCSLGASAYSYRRYNRECATYILAVAHVVGRVSLPACSFIPLGGPYAKMVSCHVRHYRYAQYCLHC